MCVVRSQTGKCWSLRSAQREICTLSKTHIHSTLCVRSLFSKGYLCTLKSPVFKGFFFVLKSPVFKGVLCTLKSHVFKGVSVHSEKPCFQKGVCAL